MKHAFIYVIFGLFCLSCVKTDDPTATTSTSSSSGSSTSTTTTGQTVDCSAKTGFDKLVCLCDNFKASLSASQLASVQLSYTFANVKTWSNLPASMSPRIGIPFSALNANQLAAAKEIVKQMSGTSTNEGYNEVEQLWLADDYLSANGGGSTYGAGNYYLAFFGTPASKGQFEIMMTGHHKTVANTYKDGALIAATPHFEATEPLSWTSSSVFYGPLNQEQTAFIDLIKSLTADQYAQAHTNTTYSDLLLGPNNNWQFPSSSTGLKGSNLTAIQKELVVNALRTYVNDIDDENAAKILSQYTGQLDNTYLLHSGNNTMNTRNDYIRIDGPNVWIEFSVQNGIIFKNNVHFHSVWRDRINDYGTTKN